LNDALQHLLGDPIRDFEILFQSRRANPAEGTETQRENIPARVNSNLKVAPNQLIFFKSINNQQIGTSSTLTP
jgi:hypothetical protein